MGPNLLAHLAGGEGGIQHFMEHLAGPVAAWWKDLGTQTEWSPEARRAIVEGVLREAAGHSIDDLERQRDDLLLGILRLREGSEPGGGGAK
jgi:hypothetical protein